MLISQNRVQFFLNFPFTEGKITHSWWSSGENTCSWLAEHAISTFCWFLHFVPRHQQRIVCAKNSWKSSATSTKEIPKGELPLLTRKGKRLFVSKSKNLIGFENDALFSKWHRHTRKKIRVLLSGVEPKTFRLLVRMLYHWATGDSWELRPFN